MKSSERRQFFRTPCDVIVEIRKVDNYTLEHSKAGELFGESEALELLSNFHQLDKQSVQLSRNLSAHSTGTNQASLLDYLDLINRKVTCLAKTVIAQNPTLADLPHQRVNLSETGLCFQSPRSYYKGATLALRLIFLPHYLSVVLFAQVLRCEGISENRCEAPNSDDVKADKDSSDDYHIAVAFLQLSEPDQQIIAQQVMAAQLIAQREAKKTST